MTFSQRPGNGDPLLLTAGQLVGVRIRLVRQSHPAQQGHGSLPNLRRGPLFQEAWRKHDIFQRRILGKQVEILENQSKVEPVLTNLIVRQVLPRQQLSVYPDLPLVRGLQKIQAPQQRGFSASRGADDG